MIYDTVKWKERFSWRISLPTVAPAQEPVCPYVRWKPFPKEIPSMSSTLKNVLNAAPAPPSVLRTPSILQNNFGVWHSNLIKLNTATKWKANSGFIAPCLDDKKGKFRPPIARIFQFVNNNILNGRIGHLNQGQEIMLVF